MKLCSCTVVAKLRMTHANTGYCLVPFKNDLNRNVASAGMNFNVGGLELGMITFHNVLWHAINPGCWRFHRLTVLQSPTRESFVQGKPLS
ncbi:hypothetical protein TIFTF001_010191 [Ficus carica]|uniref:Uncharacterized protein n=1 Tax=Ficus carica TaxID=3494 RepID=A0AA87ZW17_FICCA|nr:hypothetical protein TIFTF001_010191 [Ficus carica]